MTPPSLAEISHLATTTASTRQSSRLSSTPTLVWTTTMRRVQGLLKSSGSSKPLPLIPTLPTLTRSSKSAPVNRLSISLSWVVPLAAEKLQRSKDHILPSSPPLSLMLVMIDSSMCSSEKSVYPLLKGGLVPRILSLFPVWMICP